MILTNFKDKEAVVKLLSSSFLKNKSVLSVCKNSKSISVLMEYSFIHSHYDNLAFTNESRTAVALCKISGKEKIHVRKFFISIKLAFALGLKKAYFAMKHEKLISQHRKEKQYLHIQFIGVEPEKQGTKLGSKLIEDIKQYAKVNNLPIYLETSTPKNIPFYQNHGFESFYTLKGEFDLYFFKYS
ncbi:MAG: GNAT family N-acetyltransferase [Bacteroidota bacterium]